MVNRRLRALRRKGVRFPPDPPSASLAAVSTPREFDVVIAGLGMVGATLALSLSRAGLRVAAVDPLPFSTMLEPTFDGRASAIAFASFRQFQALGLGDRLAADAQPIRQILVTDGRSPGAGRGAQHGAFLRFDAAEIATGADEPLGWMLENRVTRAALSEAIEASDIEVFASRRVAAIKRAPGRATVTLDDKQALTAPLLVGAEGRGSLVRTHAGIDVTGWTYPQSGVVATVRHERAHEGVAYEHFLPSGPFAILPLTENRASLVWTERKPQADALRTASDGAFHAHLRRRFGDFLGEIEVVGPRFVYPLSLQLAERFTADRIALVGDAAHVIHPIAGQGLNLGLKDVAALAEVVVDAMRLGEDVGSEIVLERYARWRRVDTVGLALATDAFNRLFSVENPLVRTVREAGLAAVNRIGPARRFFMREAGGATGDLPRLLRGEAL